MHRIGRNKRACSSIKIKLSGSSMKWYYRSILHTNSLFINCTQPHLTTTCTVNLIKNAQSKPLSHHKVLILLSVDPMHHQPQLSGFHDPGLRLNNQLSHTLHF